MKSSDAIVSSDSKLLLEFYSNELSTIGQSCKGGFLTHAQQISELLETYFSYLFMIFFSN